MPTVTADERGVREAAVRDLQDLMAALDRRMPQIERLGERDIAHDAAMLKDKARRRLEELKRWHIPAHVPAGDPEHHQDPPD
jgi:hypothetical protein